MTRARKWLVGLGIAVGAGALLALVLVSLIPSDEELARRAATRLEAALGVPVTIGALHWQLLPSPRIVIENVATGQPQPLEIKILTAYFDQSALLQRRLKVERAEVQGAVLPQLSLRGLARPDPPAEAEQSGKAEMPARFTVDEIPLARLDFHDVTWISRRGIRTVYDGEVDFDAGWRPRTASVRRPDVTPATDLTLTRPAQDDRWEVRVNVGGGTANGQVGLESPASPAKALHLTGKLQPRAVEVESALRAFKHRSIVAGKVSGDTMLSASGATPGELAQTLHTATSFTLGRSTLLRFDLDKAIKTIGKDHAGNTPLDSITGQLDTQNTPSGMVIDFSNVKVRSGALSASGKARVANRRIDAEFAVDLVDGLVGVPLKVTGPLEQVQVSVPASAVAGAALGTAVLPGIGTAIGARVAAAIGKLFGAKPGGNTRTAPAGKRP